jgi:hypothetical protein
MGLFGKVGYRLEIEAALPGRDCEVEAEIGFT